VVIEEKLGVWGKEAVHEKKIPPNKDPPCLEEGSLKRSKAP